MKVRLKKLDKKGKDRVWEEVKKLSDKTVQKSVHPSNLLKNEKLKSVEISIFFLEKKDVKKASYAQVESRNAITS